MSLLAERERLPEAVARQGERAEAGVDERVLGVERERLPERAVRLRVVRRVAGLARPLLVGEAEQRPRVLVLRLQLERRLQAGDELLRARVEREACLEVLGRLGAGQRRRGRRRRGGERAAEEGDEACSDEGGESDQDSVAHGSFAWLRWRAEGPVLSPGPSGSRWSLVRRLRVRVALPRGGHVREVRQVVHVVAVDAVAERDLLARGGSRPRPAPRCRRRRHRAGARSGSRRCRPPARPCGSGAPSAGWTGSAAARPRRSSR